MELWDAYDENLNVIKNVTLVRGEPIPEGMYHLVCDILVRHIDGEYLLTQRDFNKHYGGMWEATSGGSALKGETPVECAKRELKEETGIAAENLTEVGCVVGTKNRAIFKEFVCVTDCPKDSVVLQKGETIAYQWVSREELMNMKRDRLVTERMQSFVDELRTIYQNT